MEEGGWLIEEIKGSVSVSEPAVAAPAVDNFEPLRCSTAEGR